MDMGTACNTFLELVTLKNPKKTATAAAADAGEAGVGAGDSGAMRVIAPPGTSLHLGKTPLWFQQSLSASLASPASVLWPVGLGVALDGVGAEVLRAAAVGRCRLTSD